YIYTFLSCSSMDAPPSPNHVFNFPEAEFKEDPQEEPEEEVEEDPKEDPEEGPEEDPKEGPEEDPKAEAENNVPPPATPPVGSPITLSPLSVSSSDTKDDAPFIENEALEMPPVGSTYEVGGPLSVTPFPPFHMHGSKIARLDGNTELLLSNVQYLERCEKKRKIDNETCSSEIRKDKKRMDKMEQGLGDEMQFSSGVEHIVTDVENRKHERDEEMVKVLSYDESKSKRVSEGAFMTLFGQDNETFTSTMFLYVDQLQNQLHKDEFQEDKSMAAFWYDRWMNERQMESRESKVVLSEALDASLVVTECSGTKSDEHITSSSSGTYITHVVDADIRPVNDQLPSAELHGHSIPPDEGDTAILPKCDESDLVVGRVSMIAAVKMKSLDALEDFGGVTDWYQEPSMDAPPSPNHVFNFPEAEFEEDPQEEPEEEVEEDPEEDPKEGPEEDPEEGPEEDPEAEAENDVPPPATLPVGSPIIPPPLFESSSNIKDDASVIENEALEMPPVGSTYEVGGPSYVTPFPPFHMHGSEIGRLDGNTELLLSNVQYLERCEKKHKVDMETCSSEIREGKKRMDKMEQGLGDEMQFSSRVEHRVTDVENREQERDEEMVKVKKRLGMLEANYSLVLSDRDEWRRVFLNLEALVFERLGWGCLGCTHRCW
nr:hypothetical protein [Tanacetum cinerariifolium]